MKRLICFLVVFAAVAVQAVAAEPIRLALKDTTVLRGSTFLYPVLVDSSLTGLNVTSYELDITYDPNAFRIDSIIVAGTMTQSWGTPISNVSSSHIIVAGAGITSLSGTGILLYFKITAPLALSGWGSGFTFSKAMLNEGSPTTTTRNGTVWITNLPTINVYPDVATFSVGDQQQFWVSGAVAPNNWYSTNPSVATIDANGLLTGLQSGFTRVVAQDSRAIVDTSGQIEVRAFKMIIRDSTFLQSYTVNIPIYVTDLSQVDVTSGQYTITYDPNLLTFLGSSQIGTLLEGYTPPTINQVSNRLEISFAGSSRLNGVGTQILMYLRFRASIQSYGGTWLNISNLLFNENIPGVIDDGYLVVSNRTVLGISPTSANLLVGDSLQFMVNSGAPVYPLKWSVTDTTLVRIKQNGMLTALKSGSVVVGVEDAVGKIGYTQNINIYDISLSMPDTNALSRDSVIIPISITQYAPGITAAQMIVKFDSTYFENPSVITEGTLTGAQEVYSFARRETLSIATASITPVTGPGVLWKVKLFVRYGAPKLTTSTIRLVGIIFNQGVPIPLVKDCNFYVRWERDVRVNDIYDPFGVISRDTVVTPRMQIANVRGVQQTALYRFDIGNLYTDTMTVTLAPWETRTITFAKSWTAVPSGTYVLRAAAILVRDQDTSNNVVTRNLAVVRTSADPLILSMTPNYGGNNGIVTALIHGQHFKTGATVRLSKIGYPDYVVDTSYIRVIDPTKLKVVFDFYDEPLGTWDVTVMNPDSGSATFYDGFTIEEPSKRLWVNLAGQSRIRVGRDQTYTVMYGNVGNVDAVGVLVLIRGILRGTEWKMDFTFAPSPEPDGINWSEGLGFIETETEKIIPLFIPILRANHTGQVSFSLKVPIGTPPFTLTAGISETETHLYSPGFLKSYGAKMPYGLMGTDDINWACVTSIASLAANVLGAVLPYNCYSFAVNGAINIASLATSDETNWSFVQFVANTVKDAAFCAGEILGGPIATAIKVASVAADVISGAAGIYQNCFPPPGAELPIQPVMSMDPNFKTGPNGFDTTAHYTTSDQPFVYMVEFENMASASAEAETVVVYDTLDTNLDMSTFSMITSTHPSVLTTTVDTTSRSITWRFSGINLPPNVNPPEGQGWTIFSIMPKQNLASGTQIKNSANIIFDVNPPIATNTFINTIDSGKPSSQVFTLPDTTMTGEFDVHWSGIDDSAGSGIRSYDIYVKYDSGAYVPWLVGTTDTIATFIGQNERVHSFYSIATDNVGLREDPPLSPDAITWVNGISAPVYLLPLDHSASSGKIPTFGWTPTAGKTGHYDLQYTLDSLFLSNVTMVSGMTDTFYTLPDSLLDGLYFWRVEAVSGSGSHSGYRTPFRFTIDTQPPSMPVLISLEDSSVIKVAMPTFTWTRTSDEGSKYFWECATDTSFDTVKAAYYSSDTIITVPQNMSLNRGTYYWHVCAVDRALNKSAFQSHPYMFIIDTTFVGVKEKVEIPQKFVLHQNYPNPFNPLTKIRYELPVASQVRLKIYNLLGQEVMTLVDEVQPAGYVAIDWNSTNNAGASVASGIYFYQLEATNIANPKDSFVQVKKLMLIK